MPGYEIIGKEERDAVNDAFDKARAILEDSAQAVGGEYKADKLARAPPAIRTFWFP